MAILLYFIMLLYFVSYYLYSNVYGFTLFVSYIMLSHHWLGYISQILVFNPIRSGGGGAFKPPPSDFLLSRI